MLLSTKRFVFYIALTLIFLSLAHNLLSEESQYQLISELGHGTVESTSWSPNGQLFAVSGSQGVWIYSENYQSVTHLEAQNTRMVAWSPNSSQLAVAGGLIENDWDSAVYIWDIASTHQLHRLAVSNYSSEVTAIAWHPNNSQIATSGNHSIWVWDTQTGILLRTLEETGWVKALAWSPDGESLISATNQEVSIWSTETWVVADKLSVTDVNAIAWNSDGSLFALARGSQVESDNSLQIWRTNDLVLLLVAQAGLVQTVAWNSDGQAIATGSGDAIVRVWDASTATLVARLFGHSRPIEIVQWQPGRNQLLSAAADNSIRLWNVSLDQPPNTAHESETLSIHSGRVTAIAWSPDNSRISAGSDDGNVKIWNAQTSTVVDLGYHEGIVDVVAWSPNGNLLASGDSLASVKVWDVNTRSEIYEINMDSLHLQSFTADEQVSLGALYWSPDGTYLELSTNAGAVFRWNQENGQIEQITSSSNNISVSRAIWSPYDDVIAQLLIQPEGEIRFLEVGAELEQRSLECQPCRPQSLAWSPNAEQIAAGGEYGESGGAIMIWNTQTAELVNIIEAYGSAITELDWGRSGRIASVHSNEIKIWDPISGDLIDVISGQAYPQLVRWSTDGTKLAVGTQSGTIQVWAQS